MTQPEDKARENIDRMLTLAGWSVQDPGEVNLSAHRGLAIRNFTLKTAHGEADYLLYVDGRAAGVIEAKKEGVTLTGVETQSDKYTKGLPDGLPSWTNPLPFSYESTGVETRFTNGIDPIPRSRPVFNFHKPETLAEWLEGLSAEPRSRTFLARMQHLPLLVEQGLWPAQIKAVKNLERSLAVNRPRSVDVLFVVV